MKIELDTEEAIKVMTGLRLTIKECGLDGDLEACGELYRTVQPADA